LAHDALMSFKSRSDLFPPSTEALLICSVQHTCWPDIVRNDFL